MGALEMPYYPVAAASDYGAPMRSRRTDIAAWRFTLDPLGRAMSWGQCGDRQAGFAETAPDGRLFAEVVGDFGIKPDIVDGMLAISAEQGWAERECWATRANKKTFWCSLLVTSFGARGASPEGYAVVLRDLTERKRRETELRRRAESDPLTGVFNRRSFLELAAKALDHDADDCGGIAFAMLDLDHFKEVNDRFGHAGGDEALRAFVACCRRNLRKNDLFGRLGGDEFGLLLTGVCRPEAHALLQRLQRSLAKSEVTVDGEALRLSVSIGFAFRDTGHDSVDDLMGRADRGLFAAKSRGRNMVLGAG
ncbi:diguanylate cyclase [Rhodobacteraceae bacterium NNCM2]|nr:diguanylate cyclase [Coraliihabitans acroporae]